MKILQKITLAIALITLFASCQSAKQILSKSDSRNEIITAIANDPDMSKEMMEAMMNSKNGKMMMQENEKMKMMDNHGMMMKMMKDNPGMMKNMTEAAKSDTSMMSSMCKSMMGNQQMMNMMQKMKGKNMEMHKNGKMDKKTENKEDPKSHH